MPIGYLWSGRKCAIYRIDGDFERCWVVDRHSPFETRYTKDPHDQLFATFEEAKLAIVRYYASELERVRAMKSPDGHAPSLMCTEFRVELDTRTCTMPCDQKAPGGGAAS